MFKLNYLQGTISQFVLKMGRDLTTVEYVSKSLHYLYRSLKGKCILTLRGSTVTGVNVIPRSGIPNDGVLRNSIQTDDFTSLQNNYQSFISLPFYLKRIT